MRRAALVLLAACGSDPSGTWSVDSAEWTVNDCQLDDELLPADTIDLGLGGDELEIDFLDGYGEIECAWQKNGAFDCPEVVFRSEVAQQAQLTTTSEVSGIAMRKSLDADRYGTMTCDGPDCPGLEDLTGITFPCSYHIDFTAVR